MYQATKRWPGANRRSMKRIVGSLVFVIALITGSTAALAAGHHHGRPPRTTTTTQAPATTTTSTTPNATTTTTTSTTTTTTPSSSSVAFVQDGDTGTFTGNTTSLGSGQSNQVLPYDTGIGHTVVLVLQTLTYPAPRQIPSPASPQTSVPSISSTRTTMMPTTRYGFVRTRPALPIQSRSTHRPTLGTPLP